MAAKGRVAGTKVLYGEALTLQDGAEFRRQRFS